MAFVNEDLLSKAEKEVFNGLVMDLHEKISNQMLKRQLRSKNKALCASDSPCQNCDSSCLGNRSHVF